MLIGYAHVSKADGSQSLDLFNDHGECLAAKLRSGNVHSADDWDALLMPEIERQQAEGRAHGLKLVRGPCRVSASRGNW